MGRAVLIDGVRTPIGKRNGMLAGWRAVELLRHTLISLLDRSGLAPDEVEQVIGGCVTQVGEQALNVTRNAWLSADLNYETACTTVDVSCGSAQQANHLVAALIDAGAIDVGIACGVESMSRVPLASNLVEGRHDYLTDDYPWDDPPHLQFGGAERIADREQLRRADLDAYGELSQQRAGCAWDEDRFDREVADLEPGPPRRDEGLRATNAAQLAELQPTMRGGRHTAGTISQVSDGAAAVLWMAEERAGQLGLRPRARLVAQVVTGADPYYLLDGPIAATSRILKKVGMTTADIDVFEVNEAFASVVLAWSRAMDVELGDVNVNGGAIALGHPVGATGARLLVTAVNQLEQRDGERALVTMCCGGSLGTATIVERL